MVDWPGRQPYLVFPCRLSIPEAVGSPLNKTNHPIGQEIERTATFYTPAEKPDPLGPTRGFEPADLRRGTTPAARLCPVGRSSQTPTRVGFLDLMCLNMTVKPRCRAATSCLRFHASANDHRVGVGLRRQIQTVPRPRGEAGSRRRNRPRRCRPHNRVAPAGVACRTGTFESNT
jgi:hypothetical protein